MIHFKLIQQDKVLVEFNSKGEITNEQRDAITKYDTSPVLSYQMIFIDGATIKDIQNISEIDNELIKSLIIQIP